MQDRIECRHEDETVGYFEFSETVADGGERRQWWWRNRVAAALAAAATAMVVPV